MRFIQAESIFNGQEFLPANAVLVLDQAGILKEISIGNDIPQSEIEHLNGILTPGFVNAHCHLELSALHGKIERHTGLPQFAKQVILQRGNIDPQHTEEKINLADKAMWDNGIVAVGDICNGTDSFQKKTVSGIHYHSFIELIGLNPAFSESIFERGLALLKALEAGGLSGSLAPHAPYSTSNELIALIAEFDKKDNSPLSIHNQESEEESKFFIGLESDFEALYKFLKLDVSWFKAPMVSSLKNYAAALSGTSILVHNTVTSVEDLNSVLTKNIFWCFCPNANLYIENRLPDFEIFETYKDVVCLGTDSLASNSQLDLISEANVILQNSKTFTVTDLLKAMTYNGAKALGINHSFGNLLPGKNAGLNLISYNQSKISFIKKIT